jgi:hypothetical protein
MTLTEQLKKGELEQGYYYMQIPTGDIRIITECMKVDCKGFSILSKVPSYEEWNQLHKFLEEFNALDVAKENKELKELLWACQDELYSHLDSGAEAMADAITNAIGEKK